MHALQPGQIVHVSQAGQSMTLHVHIVDTLETARGRVSIVSRKCLEHIGRQWPSARIAWLAQTRDDRLLFPVIEVSEGGEVRYLDTVLSNLEVRVLQGMPENN